ncbi:MAG: CopD family protein [Rhodobacteraceae bacterium]|nr:CopD family protein [Paracoccaceae bacterium]
MIALIKAVHLATLAVWCAGLIALPVVMQVHGRTPRVHTQPGFAEFRLLSHRAYTRVITPAAVVTITAGTLLFVLEGLRAPWMLAKLLAVAGMVLVHAWLGHQISLTGEGAGRHLIPSPLPALLAALAFMALTLWLVLAKPDLAPLAAQLPDWLLQPRGRALPSDLVPI